MISCVTFETTKVTNPIKFYECTKAHIIHYTKPTAGASVFEEFYNRVCEIIKEENGGKVEVIEHIRHVSDFSTMLSTILHIIEEEQAHGECDIFINISAGSHEYSAAAAIGAMMSDNVRPFSINTKEYTVEPKMIREIYYEDEKPVGLTKTTLEPRSMPKYTINKPPKHLVIGLRILDELNREKKPSKSGNIMEKLKEKEQWYRDKPKSNIEQTEAVQFHRDFTSKWLELGWVRKDDLRKRMVLTDKGQTIIETFYLEQS